LIDSISVALKLEMNEGISQAEAQNVPMEDIAVHQIAEEMMIPLAVGADGKDHFCQVSVSLSMNTKADGYKDELDALRVNFHVIMEKRFQLLHHKDFFRRDMIRNNPVMVSKQFKEALEDLKRAAREKVDEVKRRE